MYIQTTVLLDSIHCQIVFWYHQRRRCVSLAKNHSSPDKNMYIHQIQNAVPKTFHLFTQQTLYHRHRRSYATTHTSATTTEEVEEDASAYEEGGGWGGKAQQKLSPEIPYDEIKKREFHRRRRTWNCIFRLLWNYGSCFKSNESYR